MPKRMRVLPHSRTRNQNQPFRFVPGKIVLKGANGRIGDTASTRQQPQLKRAFRNVPHRKDGNGSVARNWFRFLVRPRWCQSMSSVMQNVAVRQHDSLWMSGSQYPEHCREQSGSSFPINCQRRKPSPYAYKARARKESESKSKNESKGESESKGGDSKSKASARRQARGKSKSTSESEKVSKIKNKSKTKTNTKSHSK